MTALTQAIIGSPLRRSMPFVDRVARAIETPWPVNHAAALDVAVGKALAVAPIYVFDEFTTRAAFGVIHALHRREHVFKTCRAPHERMFIEAHWSNYVTGWLVTGDRQIEIKAFRMAPTGPAAGLAAPLGSVLFDFDGLHLDKMLWSPVDFPSLAGLHDHALGGPEAAQAVGFTAAAWAFLNAGGVCTVDRRITRDGRLAQRKPRHAHEPALMSYNRVRLVLPKNASTTSATRFERGRGVRLHEVRGHPRHYFKDDGTLVVRWINAFWRGDARKGVVLKERTVVANPNISKTEH